MTNDEEWGALCEVAGNPDWSSDPRFQDQLSRWQHQDDIDRHISEWTANEDYKDLMHRLQGAGVTAAAVYTNQDVVEDEQLNERGYFWDTPHAASGTMPFSGAPVLLSKTPGTLIRSAHHSWVSITATCLKIWRGWRRATSTRWSRRGR